MTLAQLKEANIPVVGREPRSVGKWEPLDLPPAKITPQEAADGLKAVNSILSQPSIQGNQDVYRQWSAIKTHLNNALGEVAPDVKAANTAYAREKLGQTFAPMNAVNKSGTPSKLGMMAQQIPKTAGAAIGGSIFGTPGAVAGWKAGELASGMYHAPYVAGIQTAAGGLANKVIGPGLNATERSIPGPLIQAYLAQYAKRRNQ